jgi:hypothetical protein
MPKILRNLKISEVSAVDRGAGENCEILLMKRHQDITAKAVDALRTSVGLILDATDTDDAAKRDELATTLTEFQMYMDRELTGKSLSKGPLERETRRIRKEFEEALKADHDAGDDDDGDPVRAPAGDHHVASKVADLLVETGKYPHRAAALDHLLHNPHGAGWLARLNKKETTMDLHTEMVAIMKSKSPINFCKAVVDREYSPVSDAVLVKLTTAHAKTVFPGLAPDVAFARLYETDPTVRLACQIAHRSQINKAAGAAFDVAIVNPGDETETATNDTEQSQAYKQLEALAAKLHAAATDGKMTREQAFARVIGDSQYKALADKALRPPTPTSVFPFPLADRTRSSPGRQGDGAYHPAKSDRSEPAAYGELMVKAEEYRAAHPELSVAQCFEKIYTDPANIEIAKRERVESAPR